MAHFQIQFTVRNGEKVEEFAGVLLKQPTEIKELLKWFRLKCTLHTSK
jgi:hypothetical protein